MRPRRSASVALVLLLAAGCARGPELVRRPATTPAALFIQDVTVLDVERGTLVQHMDVLVMGDRITSITTTGDTKPPAGAQVIEGGGRTLLPGLIDVHGHVGNASAPAWEGAFPDPDANLRSFLYCGVTTVYDPCDVESQAFDRRGKVRRGELLGPTIYTAGPMFTAPGGHPVPILRELAPWWIRWYLIPRVAREVSTPEAARAGVDEVAAAGADMIKLGVDHIPQDAPRIANDVIAAVVDEARKKGLRTVAHIGSVEDALDAGRAGVAAWMHGVYKEPIPDDVIPELAQFHIPMVATIVVFESYALTAQGARVATPLEKETVPARWLGGFDKVPDGFHSPLLAFVEALRPMRAVWRENVRRLRAAGVTILAGSDPQSGVFPGPGLHRELDLLTEAGMTRTEAIRAATSDAARFIVNGKEPDFGIVAEGKRADLLLVDGDPTQDLNALARIRAVILGGTVLERIPLGSGA